MGSRRKTATERVEALRGLVAKHAAAVKRANGALAAAVAGGDPEAIAAASAKVTKLTGWLRRARAKLDRYAPIAGLDGLGARVTRRAAEVMPMVRASDVAAEKAERQREKAGAPRPIGSASIAVVIPSPWTKGLDNAEMRVSNPIKQLARRGDIDRRQARAAAWFRAVVEAAEAGGVACFDYSAVRVDTSTRGGAPVMDDVVTAMADHAAAKRSLGTIGYGVLRPIVYEGRTIAEVAATWPTATLRDGQADRQTREFIGRALREGLTVIDREFCRPLDPNRNYVEGHVARR